MAKMCLHYYCYCYFDSPPVMTARDDWSEDACSHNNILVLLKIWHKTEKSWLRYEKLDLILPVLH
jgi:hypothetical protein